jgi:hypothetical protein
MAGQRDLWLAIAVWKVMVFFASTGTEVAR